MSTAESPTLIVGVGASAGGLEAFKHLLSVLPSDSGMAFLLVQHLDPKHKSLLTELLDPQTKMSVCEADQGIRIERDTVYIIRPDTALGVREGQIELSEPTLHRGVRLPVDHLFRSLARDYGPRSVGIVLSGAGSDGSAGLRDVKSAGGLTIAQEPGSSGQPGMPKSAIDAGVVDLVLEIEDIPEALERFASLPRRARLDLPEEEAQPPDPRRLADDDRLADEDMFRLAALLEAHLSFDLRVYKPTTVERRVLRRATLSGFHDFSDYLDHLRQEPTEQQRLVRDLLISVTDFFRDPDSFKALRELVIDPLVSTSTPGTSLRAWIPGCATGEEAYSIGIEFFEAFEAQSKRPQLQIFATDVDSDALSFARTAIYPPGISEHVPRARLATYFKPLDGKGFEVCRALRDAVSFAAHDLTKDPPFSHMNLVSCRNVLIYLTTEAQQHVLDILHFGLEPEGHLFLSTSESTGPRRKNFFTVSKQHRIYKKLGRSQPIQVARSRHKTPVLPTPDKETPLPQRGRTDLARRVLLDSCLPASIVIGNEGDLLYSHGELARYLRFPQDEGPRFEVSTIVRPELATRTRGALYKCRRSGEPVTVLSVGDPPGGAQVRITAKPARELGDDAVILTFEDIEPSGEEVTADSPEEEAVAEQLERELQATREDLRNTVEELETSNEELRSSNEESMSMNEELQSANEELEATTEELRSLNEELTTVNSQLREKIEQLEQAHDDLNNFVTSAKLATIFLDGDLRVKRFTPAARSLLAIDDGDVGRSIGTVARELLQYDLEHEVRMVLENLIPRSREIETREGRWIARQVLPYRTESQRIEGVVVTFADITEVKAATQRLAVREEQQAAIARLGLHALQQVDLQEFMDRLVADVNETLGTDFCKLLEVQPGSKHLLVRAGAGWRHGTVGSASEPTGAESPAGYALMTSEPLVIDDFASESRFAKPAFITEHGVTSGVSCPVRDGDYRYGVLSAYTKHHRVFTEEDANFLLAITNVLGSAIGRYQVRIRLALELGVAHVLAEAVDLDETLGRLLERIAQEIASSTVAELWSPGEDGRLERRALHVAPPTERVSFERHLRGSPMAPGEGLIGQVYERARAIWYTDLGQAERFKERVGDNPLKLVSGLALPVVSSSRTLGVIALFSSERLFADETYLHSLESIGRSIGDFIQRWEDDQQGRALAAIIQSSHDAISSYRFNGTVTAWLPGAEDLFGWTEEEMLGKSYYRIVPKDRKEELDRINQRLQRGEVVDPFETVRVRKDGSLVEVSVRSSAVRDAEDRVVGISAIDRDIGAQKDLERALVEGSRQKDEFLAMLGHELRNPLAAIRSAAELLGTGADPATTDRVQTVLERQTQHVTKLLDGLLDVSRIARGQIHLDREIVDFATICHDLCDEVRARPDAESRTITAHIEPTSLWVYGDRVRLVQIVDNLLSNALRHTDDGGRVDLLLKAEDDLAELRVVDDGAGIEPDFLPSIFEPFRQARQDLARTRGGFGLGLALVKHLVDLHEGTVEAHSPGRDQGAEFVVRLPAAPQEHRQRSDAPAPEVRPLCILIVEDNQDAAELLQEILQAAGHEVHTALDGEKAVSLAEQTSPEVVLCDLGLPGMNGFEVARALRSKEATRDSRLVAISGYGQASDRERGQEAGFDAHLVKPVDLASLRRLLAEFFDGSEAPPAPHTSERTIERQPER